jgi:hypothetical protein
MAAGCDLGLGLRGWRGGGLLLQNLELLALSAQGGPRPSESYALAPNVKPLPVKAQPLLAKSHAFLA